MAAYLNRTLSMVSGNSSATSPATPSTAPVSTSSANMMDMANALTDSNIQRGLHHSGIDSSPLQIFVRAKKKINDIFSEIEDYVVETTRFIDGECSASLPLAGLLMVIVSPPSRRPPQ